MSPLLWLAAALAGADPLVDALAAELERDRALSLGDTGAPYFVGYDLFDVWGTSVTAAFGAVVSRESQPARTLGVAVRVGSPELDSANFDDRWAGNGFRADTAVLGDDPIALRRTAWYTTDLAYKEAIENLARRVAARERKASSDDPAAFAPGPPQVAEEEPVAPVPVEALEPIATALSAVFLDHPQIEWSRVYTGAENGRRLLVDAVGTRVVKAEAEVNVRAVARIRADDGAWMTDHASWAVRGVDHLPPIEEMVAATRAMAERLEAWRAAPVADDDYVGPVLFEDGAAIEVVRALLIPALSGTPPVETAPAGSRNVVFSTSGEGATEAVRVRRRFLPTGFDVRDDPTADPSLPSSFRFDDEGELAQPIELVVDGVIRTHYASRTPSTEVTASNGHARGGPGGLLRGTASWTRLETDHGLAAKKLHKLALAQAGDYGSDHYVVLRRIQDPAIAASGSQVLVDFDGDDSGPLLPPLVAVRKYADGREEAVRGWKFVGVDHRMLRDVVAAGTEVRTWTLVEPAPGDRGGGPLSGEPTTISTPDLLFAEVELATGAQPGERPPALPSPLAR